MAGVTLAVAQAQLELWLAADAAVASGQSYSIKDRSLSRADAAEITNKIEYWNGWVQRLSRAASGRGRTRYVVNE
jgi:hypothetical protein